MNLKFKKGVSDFIKGNGKNIKVPLKEFLFLVSEHKDIYPSFLEKKMRNLKRDWNKKGYVNGFAVAWNVYEKLKKAKYLVDLLPMTESFQKAYVFYSDGVEAVSTVVSILDELAITRPLLKPINPSKITSLRLGSLFKIVSIPSLFLMSTSLGEGSDVSPKTDYEKYMDKLRYDPSTKWEKVPDQKNNDKKKKSDKMKPLLPFAAGAGLGAGGALPMILLLGALLMFSGKKSK